MSDAAPARWILAERCGQCAVANRTDNCLRSHARGRPPGHKLAGWQLPNRPSGIYDLQDAMNKSNLHALLEDIARNKPTCM